MKIIWNGTSATQTRNDGYKVSEDQIYGNLVSLGLEIEHDCIRPTSIQDCLDNGINLLYESQNTLDTFCDLLINNRLPFNYTSGGKHTVGFSYWETTILPKKWVMRMNQMDEIWTTSQWAKDVFINSGVSKDIYNFKLGVHSDLFYPKLRKIEKDHFTFLSIGSPSTRKNSQIAVDAFLKLFGKDDRYKLLYKSTDAPDARMRDIYGQLGSIYNQPNIEVIDRDVPIEELADIYDRADCLIYPTSGEGWGMLPFQAIAKGIPTICTNATACTEYAHLSVPLDFTWGTSKMSGIYMEEVDECGEWAIPNFDDLCDKMLYVVNNYDKVSKFTYDNAMSQFDKWSWESITKDYYDRICQILKK